MANVHDHLKPLLVEDRKQYYEANTIPAAVAMTHVRGDFNFSNVLRTANFFGFREVFYIGGSRQWDRRGAVGVQNYLKPIYCHDSIEFFKLISGRYTPVALENNIPDRNPHNIFGYEWPDNPVIIVGEEQLGLTADILNNVVHFVEIPTSGTVRSMNVGTAAGMAMFHYKEQLHIRQISLT